MENESRQAPSGHGLSINTPLGLSCLSGMSGTELGMIFGIPLGTRLKTNAIQRPPVLWLGVEYLVSSEIERGIRTRLRTVSQPPA